MTEGGHRDGERPSAADLARKRLAERIQRGLERARSGAPPSAAAAPGTGAGRIPRRDPDRATPLSFPQQRFWFLEQLHAGTAGHHIARAFRLRGALDGGRLAAALAGIVRRHESLRTALVDPGDGVPIQEIPARLAFRLPRIDLSSLDGSGRRRRELERLRRAEAEHPFALGSPPLLRARLLRLGAEDHVLLFTFHHAVADGWSMAIFYRELATLFAGRALDPLPIQVADHAAWQRQRLDGERLAGLLDDWSRRLEGAPLLLELPLDRTRPATRRLRGALCRGRLAVDAGALGRLGEAAATPFMVGLAAFAAVLERWGAGSDLLLGTPVAGRTEPETEGLIGLFVNTLPLRLDLSGDPTFRQLVERARGTTLAAQAAQELPFERLVERLAPDRSLTHPPVVQAVFSLLAQASERLELGELVSERIETRRVPAQFDLNLTLAERADGFEAVLVYDVDLFDPDTAQRLVAHYATLLTAAVADPGQRLWELPLAGDRERRQVVAEWNRTAVFYPRHTPLHELVAARAAAAADRCAVTWEGGCLTYGKLVASARELTAELRRLGVGAESRVGLLLERSGELPVSMLAVLAAGAAYVPLDPEYPAERIAWLAADADVQAVLTTSATLDRTPLPSSLDDCPLVRLDRPLPAPGTAPAGEPGAVSADQLAYIMYTSGSTGRPKGVEVSHRNVLRLVIGSHYTSVARDEVYFQLAPTAFDASTFEIWAPLLHGATLALARAGRASLAELTGEVARQRVTTLWLTSGLFHQLVDERLDELLPPTTALRSLLTGGDVVSPRRVERVLTADPRLHLVAAYGPTENTTFTTCHPMGGPHGGLTTARVPIGKPISNTRAYVVDRYLKPVPIGVPGELCAGGDGVARGYRDRPALTAERFVPDPFAGEPGAGPPGGRLYATGDRVRWRPDGGLDFLGRVDHQVKIRGYRVEPGEVEAALARLPGVAACAVTVRDDGPQAGRQLVGYAVGERGPADPTALRRALRELLPEAMVPSAIVAVDEIPLDPNGKPDRRALPAPDWSRGRAEAPEAAGTRLPTAPLEELVLAIWSEVLGREGIRPGDDFFDLGGHSLLATQVVARLERACEVSLPLAALFEHPTPAGLARQLAAGIAGLAGRPPAPPLRPRPEAERSEPPPLSFAQERLWFLDRLEGSTAYHVPVAIDLPGDISSAAVAGALDALRHRHEALRTVFANVAGRPHQAVLPPAPVPLARVDLSALPAELQTDAARRLEPRFAVRPFDLGRGPLLRAAVLRRDGAPPRLLLVLHHIVTDGWSMAILAGELSELLAAARAGRPARLEPLPIQYPDFAAWQRRWLGPAELAPRLDFWRRRLAGIPDLELPADRPPPPALTRRAGLLRFPLPAALAAGLRELARGSGATLFMALLAGFQALLARWAGQPRFAVGTPVAGRTHTETERLIGFLVNTLALRADLADDPRFGELLERVRSETLGAYAHQDLPFDQLIAALTPERHLARAPLVQVLFALQNLPRSPAGDDAVEISLTGLDTPPGAAAFDITMTLRETDDGSLAGLVVYDRDRFESSSVRQMIDAYRALLEGAVLDPSRRTRSLPLLGSAQRHRVVAEWPATARAYPADATVYSLFAGQVAGAPDAIALTWRGGAVSYRGLAAAASRLARLLRHRGVRPEARVGLLLDRSPELVVAILAVLEAGGVYVPLDPEYPPERLAFIAEDAGIATVVATADTLDACPPAARGRERTVIEVAGPAARAVGASDTGEEPVAGGPAVQLSPDHLAYVMYTSGSTGRPKGVAIPHRGIVRLVADPDWVELGPGETILLYAAVSFDASTFELWGALARGGRLAFTPAGPASLAELAATVVEQGVTTLWLTAGLFHQMAEDHLPVLAGLRQLVAGGDVLAPAAVERVFEHLPGTVLVNGYGPTENSAFTTSHPMRTGADRRRTATVPIGRPIPGTRVLILDRQLAPVPPGMPGELYTGGAGVARGYLDRPALTAEQFVPDPFAGRGGHGERGDRLYRTGDRARWLADGTVEFLGRADRQVKLRGHRVEPGEVEATLGRHPALTACAVVVRDDAPGGDRRLVAYAAVAQEAGADAAALRDYLRERLPEPMVPSHLVLLDDFPLDPNGKIDRRALPAPDWSGSGGDEPSEPPRTPLEELVINSWREVLGHERIGRGDSFFDLGGHSLLATRVVSRLERACGAVVPLRLLFEAPTPAALAGRLTALLSAEERSAPVPIERLPGEAAAPLSWAQDRLWFLEQFEPGSSLLLMPLPLRLEGELDRPALAAALSAVVARHDALRTTVTAHDGEPRQHVAPAAPVPLPLIDLSALPAAAGEREGRALLEADARRPLDLETGPLYGGRLLRLGRREHLLSWVMHHLVSDGWSVAVFLDELAAGYTALAEDRRADPAATLAPLPIAYRDYAAWQRAPRSEALFAAQLEWWAERLAGAPAALDLPTDRPRPRRQSYRAGTLRHTLPPAALATLSRLAEGEGATLFMALLAALAALLARLSGQRDVLVGTPVAGRTRPELEGLIGLFLNTLVLRLDAGSDDRPEDSSRSAPPRPPAFRELLARAKEAALGAYGHQDVPFERLLAALEPERDPSRTPFFSVFLNLLSHGELAAGRRLGRELRATPVATPAAHSKFDWTLYVSESTAGLRIGWVYNADLFDAARMEETARQLAALIERAAAAPDRPVAEHPLLTPQAAAALPDPRQPLSDRWHGAVHELFAGHATADPERPAALGPGCVLSYGAVERAANRLAHGLAAAGVAAGDSVAIWAHRSPPLVIALLAAMKCGGVFVMLDPAYPPPRLAAMLRRARPAAWIALAAAGPLPAEAARELSGRPGFALESGGETSGPRGEPLTGPDAAPEVDITRDAPSYIAFTSGSTGEPKGIVGRHGSLSHFIPWQIEAFGLGPEDRVSCLSGLAHDPLHRDLFTPLQVGAAAVFPEPERIGEPGYLAAWARREGVTVAHLTPAMGQILAQPAGAPDGGGPADGRDRVEVPSLRWIFLVGDVLTRRDVDRLHAMAPNGEVVNLYGSTETQRAVGYHLCARGGPGRARREVLPLGRGIPAVQLLVLDTGDRQAGIGELGEIAVRSPHLALGYLDEPERTADRFAASPWAAAGDDGDRCYRTGDLGRYRPDGEVEFAGRADQQVKIRGFRIELGEVQAALGRHPDVAEAAVLARRDPGRPGDRYLAAYVVPARGADPAAGPLRRFLADSLPDYMVPAAFVTLDALPLTPNRKLDRSALPQPRRPAGGGTEEAPRSPAEEAAVEVFRAVLGAERIGVHDRFFELGGHSLLATQVVARLGRTFGVELPLVTLFAEPTPAGLARAIETQMAASRGTALPPITPVPRAGADLPLSYSQQRQWFLDRLEPGQAAYNIPLALHLAGPGPEGGLAPALAWALSAIVDRHEALRSRFAEGAGGPVQRVEAPWAPLVPLVDLSGLSAERRREEALRWRRGEAEAGFDLLHDRLLRSRLLRLDDDEHWLLVTLHHIVGDGWSVTVLVRELRRLVAAFAAGERGSWAAAGLPPLPVQYGDYAVWQRRELSGEVLDRHLDWWRRELTAVPPLELPTDRPRPPVQTHRGLQVPFTLEAGDTAELRALAQRQGATLFMLLLAGYQALLARAAGQHDFAVGTYIANRTHSELEGLIGFFVNNLALRADVSGDPGFDELLGRVRRTTLGAYAHQDAPFELVLDAVRPQRDLSRTPLFQTLLVLQNLPRRQAGEDDLAAGLLWESLPKPSDRAHFDLTLWVWEAGDRLTGQLEVNADLFDAATAHRLAARFGRLLAAAAGDPRRSVATLPHLTAEEATQLTAWGSAEPAAGGCLHELVAEQAARTPDAVAVVDGDRALSYGGLMTAAGGIAARLRAALPASGEPVVAISQPRSLELIAGLLGILEAGAAYLPLDPSHPPDRLRFTLRDAGAALLLGDLPAAARPDGMPHLAVDAAPVAPPPRRLRRPANDPARIAYVIYTSGSTGRPKGVAVPHGAVSGYAADASRRFGLAPGVRMLQFASASFDASAEEIWSTLAAGATLVLRDDACLVSPERFFAACERWRIGVIGLPTAFWHQLVTGLDAGAVLPRDLRLVILGGERARAGAFERWWHHAGGRVRLLNTYGPTEASIVATAWEAAGQGAAGALARAEVPIGRPVEGTRTEVLDTALRRLPPGAPGELCLGEAGAGPAAAPPSLKLARGYLGRPALTAERFVPDPRSGREGGGPPGARLYRTGDRVRWLADGDLSFLGRTDLQVKLRGFRVEPEEIEAVLTSLPGVAAAAVAAREAPPGDLRLIAWVVPAGGGDDTARAPSLRRALAAELPAYMVPAAFEVIARLPLNAAGKVDRRALPDPDWGRAAEAGGGDTVAPRDAVEAALAAIWAEVLGIAEPSVHDDFFALGGHSLLATQVVSRAQRLFAVELRLAELFAAPTVAALAARLRTLLAGGPAAEAAAAPPPITPSPRPDADADGVTRGLPLSFAQERLFFLDRLQPDDRSYHLPAVFRLRGPLRPAALDAAMSELVRRHETLRSRLLANDGTAAPDDPAGPIAEAAIASAAVDPPRPVRVPVVDLAALPGGPRRGLRRREARRLVSRLLDLPFDLEAGPLLRSLVVELAPDERLLASALHHAIADGWSLEVMRRELAALLAAAAAGTASPLPPLPPLPIQYADWAAWQRRRLPGPALAEQIEWWRNRLAGAPPVLDLPTDRPRRAQRTGRGGTVSRHLGGQDAAGWKASVHAAARRAGITPFMALLGAFAALLGRWSGQRDLVVGTPVAGRDALESEGLIGLFVNTLALRVRLGDGDGAAAADLLEQVRETALGAFAHQELPFERLVAELAPRRDLAHTPLFQVLFVLHNPPRAVAPAGGLELEWAATEATSAQFDLSLSLAETASGFVARLQYDRDLFDRTTPQRLLGHFEVLARAVAEEPTTTVGALPLLTAGEARQLAEWNDTARGYPGPLTLPELIAERAAAGPDAVAVAFESDQLSYAGLLAAARRLAAELRSRGVGPGVRVGVAMERSAELVVALVAVVEAGGAFVPIDPDNPDERLAFLLADFARGRFTRGRFTRSRFTRNQNTAVVLTREHLRRRLAALTAGSDAPELLLAGRAALRGAASPGRTAPRLPAPGADDPAYALYTSGSTGRPKAAVNSHRAIHNRLAWMQEALALTPGDRVLQKTPAGFDVSVWEFFWPLAVGARLVVARPGGHQDPAYLARTIAREGITTLHFVPSMLQVFLGERGLDRLGSLRRVVLSGEALPPELVRRASRRLPAGARLHNLYGPTEAAIDVTWWPAAQGTARGDVVPIGRPIANTRVHLTDPALRPVPAGIAGELMIAGVQVGGGYPGRPALTAERFVPDPFAGEPGARMYRTGDSCRLLPDGRIDYLGRLDFQVKVRGVRIELGEVEAALAACPKVAGAVVIARTDGPAGAGPALVGYWVADPADGPGPATAALRTALRRRLPEPMVPASLVRLDELPLTANGKVDRKALPAPRPEPPLRPDSAAAPTASPGGGGRTARAVAGAFAAALGRSEVPTGTSFFDLGGHSLLLIRVQRQLARELGVDIPVVDLFRFPTVDTLTAHLAGGETTGARAAASAPAPAAGGGAIAVIGMAGRFPGADDIEQLWSNLAAGVESIRRFGADELRAAGVDEATLADPRYVPAGAPLDGPDRFDAAYFDIPPREAQIMDPQQRVFLECAVTALDDAAIAPDRYAGRIGVFAGSAETAYLLRLAGDERLLASVGAYQAWLANKADYLPSRVAYKLDLRGPALNVQTACSTSLVAIHLACRSLADGECEVALAGGVSVGSREPRGYLAEEGGIASPDGHTRTFAAGAAGTVRGHGVGIVALKRLDDALADGDRIRAVVLGTAINNDGGARAGYTAPGVDGQVQVISAALARAGVSPGEVGYIEAHGTGTRLGDPIEIAALQRAFAEGGDRDEPCALGSVKTNFGHLDAAAGVAGFIKTVLALERELIPPSLHFDRPNPEIDFAAGPFEVAAEPRPWRRRQGKPRHAGVSSFGIGGTNAHAVLREAPTARSAAPPPPRAWQLLPLSARTPEALAASGKALADHLEASVADDPAALGDVAWTLQEGRRRHRHRGVILCRSRSQAAAALRGRTKRRSVGGEAPTARPATVFLLPGQGAQRPGMAAALHAAEPVFRDTFDRCRSDVEAAGGPDLGSLLELPDADADADADANEWLRDTAVAQPAIFAVEMALAALWRAWGIEPAALLGHSLGELVAACLAGVFTPAAAAELIVARGRLMASAEPGAMLAAELGPDRAERLCGELPGLCLAAVNAPDSVVLAGGPEAVSELAARLAAEKVTARRLAVSHAFHSPAMEPILEPFAAAVERAAPRPPRMPVISNRTGEPLTAGQATDPAYWSGQLRHCVRFADGIGRTLEELGPAALLEVGPGRTLGGLARRHPAARRSTVIASQPGPRRRGLTAAPGADGELDLARALARLWTAGVEPDWAAVHGGRRRKVGLPGYPFERRSFWIDGPQDRPRHRPRSLPADELADLAPEPASREGSGLEPALIRLFAELLGVAGVGPHDDFFDLGGSSLLAVRFGSRARSVLGLDVPPQLLLEHPTAADLAAALETHGETPAAGRRPGAGRGNGNGNGNGSPGPGDSLLVELAGGRRPPLVLVHPAGGHVFLFRELAAHLGPHAVWGLRAQGLAAGEEPLRTIEELAARYLEALDARGPDRPLLLGGSSMGGMVAFEMAQRLAAAGEPPPPVALFDTYGPGQMPAAGGDGPTVTARPERGRVESAEAAAAAARLERVMRANTAAMHAYRPRPFPGRLHFFRAASRRQGEPGNPERAWLDLARGGTEFHVIPGDHESLLAPPGVERIALRLQAAIEAAAVGSDGAAVGAGPVSRSKRGATRGDRGVEP